MGKVHYEPNVHKSERDLTDGNKIVQNKEFASLVRNISCFNMQVILVVIFVLIRKNNDSCIFDELDWEYHGTVVIIVEFKLRVKLQLTRHYHQVKMSTE